MTRWLSTALALDAKAADEQENSLGVYWMTYGDFLVVRLVAI